MIFELAQDFHDAVATMPRAHARAGILEQLLEFVLRHPNQLIRSPLSLASQFSVDFAGNPGELGRMAQQLGERQGHAGVVRLNSCSGRRAVAHKVDLPFRGNVTAINCLSDSDNVLVCSEGGDIVQVDAKRRMVTSSTRFEGGRLRSAVAGPCATVFCLMDGSSTLRVLDSSLTEIKSLSVKVPKPGWVAYSRSADIIAVGGLDSVDLITPSGARRRTFSYPSRAKVPVPYGTNVMSFNGVGSLLAIACCSGDVLVLDLHRGEFLQKKGYCGHGAMCIVFESDHALWAGSLEGTLLRWDLETGESHLWSAGDDAVESLLWLEEDAMLVSGHRSGSIRLWHVSQNEPIMECGLSSLWVRALAKPPRIGQFLVGTDEVLFLPAKCDALRSFTFREVQSVVCGIVPVQPEVIIAAGEVTLHYPVGNEGMADVVPIGSFAASLRDSSGAHRPVGITTNADTPWHQRDRVLTTAVCVAQEGQLAFIGCSDGSLFGLALPSRQVTLGVLVSEAPITSICCNRSGNRLVFASGRSLFALTLGPNAKPEHGMRARVGHELKAFPLLAFIGEDHVVCDTGVDGGDVEHPKPIGFSYGTDMEIRRFENLERTCSVRVPTTLVAAAFTTRGSSIIALAGDIRFAQMSHSHLTGTREFQSGRLAPVKTCLYPIWRVPLAGLPSNPSFAGQPEQLCAGHFSPPIGLTICDGPGVVAVLARDGNLSFWRCGDGVRIQEVQLRSKGLAGPVCVGASELMCADNGQGSETGPETYYLRLVQ